MGDTPLILVWVGIHKNGLQEHEIVNTKNLRKLVRLHHNVKEVNVVQNPPVEDAKQQLQTFLNDKAASEKFIYYVGHGTAEGCLVFRDGELYLDRVFLPDRFQTLHLFFFMCYQHEAFVKLRTAAFDQGRKAAVKNHVRCTQDEQDQMNDAMFNYQIQNYSPVMTQTSLGDAKYGHYVLAQVLADTELNAH